MKFAKHEMDFSRFIEIPQIETISDDLDFRQIVTFQIPNEPRTRYRKQRSCLNAHVVRKK